MPEGTIKQSFSVSTGPLPASRKVHVAGKRHPLVNVAMREIDLPPTANEPPVRVYDPSGPYTDPAVAIDIAQDWRRCAPPGSARAATSRPMRGAARRSPRTTASRPSEAQRVAGVPIAPAPRRRCAPRAQAP